MKTILRHTGVILYFFVLTTIYSYPLIFNMKTHIPYGYEGPTDGLLIMWNIMSNIKNIENGKIFSVDGNIFYPQKSVLSLNERSVLNSFIALPLYKLTGNRAFVFNILFYLIFILFGYGFFIFLHSITQSFFVSLISSTAVNYFGFYYYPQNIYPLSWEWSIFSIYFLYLFFKEGKTRWCVLSGIFYVFTALSSMYIGVMLTYVIAFFFLFFTYNYNLFKDYGFVRRFIITFLISGIIVLLFWFPYLRNYASMAEIVTLSDKMGASYRFMSFFVIKKETSLLWWNLTHGVLVKNTGEWESFLGLTLTLGTLLYFVNNFRGVFLHKRDDANLFIYICDRLIIGILIFLVISILIDTFKIQVIFPNIGNYNTLNIANYGFMLVFFYFLFKTIIVKNTREKFISAMKSIPSMDRFFVYLFIVSFILSLGPLGGLFVLFDKFLPGFAGMRAPHRIFRMGLIAAGVLSAISIKRLTEAGRLSVLIILLLTIAEYYNYPLMIYKVPSENELPPVYKWLEEQRGDYAVIEIPLQKPDKYYKNIEEKRRDLLIQTQYMYFSTFHNKKLVNGYSSFVPEWYMKLTEVMMGFPDEVSLFKLKQMGVRYIIIHKTLLSPAQLAVIKEGIKKFWTPSQIINSGNEILLELSY